MHMAKESWDAILPKTISICWDHTSIQRSPILLHISAASKPSPSLSNQDDTTWEIIWNFALTDMMLPKAEDALKDCLGEKYDDECWRPVLDTIMAAKGDVNTAIKLIGEFQLASDQANAGNTPHAPCANTAQSNQLGADLMLSLAQLKEHNHILVPYQLLVT